jgi:hypothetical protein
MREYSKDTELSTFHNLVVNPSKINSSTVNTVNYNYWAPLPQSQIVIKDGFFIYQEHLPGGSSYTCLKFIPSEFYNINYCVSL